MFKNVLVAVDGSDSSQSALNLVKDLSKVGMLETITLISVATVPLVPLEATDFIVQENNHLEQIAFALVNKIKEDLDKEGLTVGNIVVINGDPGLVISHYARENKFDLIIMGSRGLSGVKGIVLGSVSHKVLHTAECPVLIYKS